MFANRVEIVTGAPGRIGAGVAAAFVQAGAKWLCWQEMKSACRLAEETEHHGGIAMPVRCTLRMLLRPAPFAANPLTSE